MKKFLSILASVGLVATSATSVVACGSQTAYGHISGNHPNPGDQKIITDKTRLDLQITQTGYVTIKDPSVEGKEIKVSSANQTIAIAEITGNLITVAALMQGSTKISVICGEKQTIIEVNVQDNRPKVDKVTLSQSSISIKTNETGMVGITSNVPVGVRPSIESSNPNIAIGSIDVDNKSKYVIKIAPLSAGKTTLTVWVLDKSTTLEVMVAPNKKTPTAVEVSDKNPQIKEGETKVITITNPSDLPITDSDTSDYSPAQISSANPSIAMATVSGNTITIAALKVGSTKITVSVEGVSCDINVDVLSSAPNVTSITTNQKVEVIKGQTISDTFSFVAENNNDLVPQIDSEDPNVSLAQVSGNKITYVGNKIGTTVVNLTIGNKSVAIDVTVKTDVPDAQPIKLDCANSIQMAQSDLKRIKITSKVPPGQFVKVSSADDSIAFASPNNTNDGIIVGSTPKLGTTQITIIVANQTKVITVTVVDNTPKVDDITLSKNVSNLEWGEHDIITVNSEIPNGVELMVGSQNAQVAIAEISDKTITIAATGVGTTIITVKALDKTAQISVTIEDNRPKVESVNVKDSSETLEINSSITNTITSSIPKEVKPSIEVDDSSIALATISQDNNNQITIVGLKVGTAKFTIWVLDKSTTFTVTVKDSRPTIDSLTLDKTSLTLPVGTTSTAKITTPIPNGNNAVIKVDDMNTAIANVDGSTIYVAGLKEGTTNVTVTLLGKTTTLTVNVVPVVSNLTLSQNTLEVKNDGVLGTLSINSPASLPIGHKPTIVADDPTIAIAQVSGTSIVVAGIKEGTTKVTVTLANASATFVVTVVDINKLKPTPTNDLNSIIYNKWIWSLYTLDGTSKDDINGEGGNKWTIWKDLVHVNPVGISQDGWNHVNWNVVSDPEGRGTQNPYEQWIKLTPNDKTFTGTATIRVTSDYDPNEQIPGQRKHYKAIAGLIYAETQSVLDFNDYKQYINYDAKAKKYNISSIWLNRTLFGDNKNYTYPGTNYTNPDGVSAILANPQISSNYYHAAITPYWPSTQKVNFRLGVWSIAGQNKISETSNVDVIVRPALYDYEDIFGDYNQAPGLGDVIGSGNPKDYNQFGAFEKINWQINGALNRNSPSNEPKETHLAYRLGNQNIAAKNMNNVPSQGMFSNGSSSQIRRYKNYWNYDKSWYSPITQGFDYQVIITDWYGNKYTQSANPDGTQNQVVTNSGTGRQGSFSSQLTTGYKIKLQGLCNDRTSANGIALVSDYVDIDYNLTTDISRIVTQQALADVLRVGTPISDVQNGIINYITNYSNSDEYIQLQNAKIGVDYWIQFLKSDFTAHTSDYLWPGDIIKVIPYSNSVFFNYNNNAILHSF
ncbi:lipoprotein [Mesoplasma lactucae]|uniref:Uncharacterized protein n=1 Tax=Mesoplasma lactucae ATCC 49193 TaxID=81460 RepID=A0A291IS02_9MOLU|nr:lipoprotein [Mesoplasma lactucae]ATG97579.1 hypothetical protein CP520_02330 [Mesoplasma lactucae ATCC 49193]ATZ19962.1 hypothetical protein MLACT_v1c01400 [Mesoplasma lactucae ATCC 49193]MCL8217087.1 hypothetical protein [Mesoplasma lactucae ATCC 49193]